MFCPKCGVEVKEGEKFCHSCGADLLNSEQPSHTEYDATSTRNRKSRIGAGLLQIFLGSLGIGRFYLGYTGIGVAQLLVSIFTFGIGSIWPFIDGILILTGNPKCDADGVPLQD